MLEVVKITVQAKGSFVADLPAPNLSLFYRVCAGEVVVSAGSSGGASWP